MIVTLIFREWHWSYIGKLKTFQLILKNELKWDLKGYENGIGQGEWFPEGDYGWTRKWEPTENIQEIRKDILILSSHTFK